MKKILQIWLNNQLQMLSGSKRAVLLTGPPDEGPYDQILLWPDGNQDCRTLSHVAKVALNNKRSVIKTLNNKDEETGEPLDALACPLYLGDRQLGVVAIEMTSRSQPMQKAMVQHVQAGAVWLDTMLQQNGSAVKDQLVHLVDLVAAGLEHDHFRVAATEVANILAELFSCHRVSIGFLSGNHLRVEALSHSSKIDQHSNLVHAIREAMTEALDQACTIAYPVISEEVILVTRFHAKLAKIQNHPAICTLPLIKNGKAVGAIVLERSADHRFTRETVIECEQIAMLLGPVLEIRRADDRSLVLKFIDALGSAAAKLFGPRHLSLKAVACLVVGLLTWLCLAQGQFRITCDAVLEAEVCRAVVAPQQGYIASAYVTAGDLVRQGDLLATLDDQELRIEQRKWQSQRAQLLKEYRKALAGSDRAEVAILKAKRTQAEAQLKLVNQQLGRTALTAPFPGLIVKGDLSQSLGSPVTRGEVLYEVAPIDKYRVILKVDDRDIGLVTKGQHAYLKLSGMPGQTIDLTIDRLTPVATAHEGRNYFRVDAQMEAHSDLMRPGMEGITKIEIAEKKLIWIWTRRMVDWLRLFVWNRLP